MSGAASLFFNNEQGLWLDPSDFSTLFQDSAGTTPVTAVEQPVGLMLDKSKGLVLGAELVTNGGFDSGTTGWTQVGGVMSANSGRLRITADGDSAGRAQQPITCVIGKSYELLYEKYKGTNTATNISIAISYGSLTGALFTSSSAIEGAGRAIFVATQTTHYALFHGATVTNGLYSEFDNISVRELPGDHGKQATSASRPVLKQDTNGKYYLFFDGVDDSLSTAAINFTATDKMTVVAGVRKLSDAVAKVLVELSVTSDTNNGSFGIFAPGGTAAPNYVSVLRGTAITNIASTVYASPITNVISVSLDISGSARATEIFPRVNGAIGATVGGGSADAGAGNFGNYPLFIGRRNNTSLPLNGHLYSLIVRGAQSSDSQIVSAESYVNSKTGAWG